MDLGTKFPADWGWLAALLAAALSFCYARFLKKSSVLVSSLLALSVLLMGLFIFNEKISVEYAADSRPETVILVDASLSAAGPVAALNNRPDWRKLSGSGRYPVLYFADRVSDRPGGVNAEYTALFDCVQAAFNLYGSNSALFLFSDFNDNSSFQRSNAARGVYPVVIGPRDRAITGDVLADSAIPETIQSGEKVPLAFTVYSGQGGTARIRVSGPGGLLFRGSYGLKKGLNEITDGAVFNINGYQELETVLEDSPEIPTVKTLVRGLSEKYRILFAAGRPSEEYAHLKRFLDGVRWLTVDKRLLLRPGEKISVDGFKSYNGILLMDLEDGQVGDWNGLKGAVGAGVPVFYAPGLREYARVRGLMGLFTNLLLMDDVKEVKFHYDNNELVVKCAFDNPDILLDSPPSRRLFLGWDTWKWDFQRLSEGMVYNNYGGFWQNNVNFLLKNGSGGQWTGRLNYFAGDEVPGGLTNLGLHRFVTNGNEALFRVGHNPRELSLTAPDTNTAALFGGRFDYLDDIRDLQAFVESKDRGAKVQVRKKAEIDFRSGLAAFLILLLALFAFWLLRDLGEAKK